MKGNIVVSRRGQITLPAFMRRRLGIKAGGVLVVEDRKPEKDRPVFASAQRCKATHFLTGDRRHSGLSMKKPTDTMGIVVQAVGDSLAGITK